LLILVVGGGILFITAPYYLRTLLLTILSFYRAKSYVEKLTGDSVTAKH
jgi:hypothetical protein